MDFNEYKALNINYMRRGRSRIYVGKMYAIVLGITYISLLYAILGRHRKGNETDRQKNKILTLKP